MYFGVGMFFNDRIVLGFTKNVEFTTLNENVINIYFEG